MCFLILLCSYEAHKQPFFLIWEEVPNAILQKNSLSLPIYLEYCLHFSRYNPCFSLCLQSGDGKDKYIMKKNRWDSMNWIVLVGDITWGKYVVETTSHRCKMTWALFGKACFKSDLDFSWARNGWFQLSHLNRISVIPLSLLPRMRHAGLVRQFLLCWAGTNPHCLQIVISITWGGFLSIQAKINLNKNASK
jgi:hypothetical protein